MIVYWSPGLSGLIAILNSATALSATALALLAEEARRIDAAFIPCSTDSVFDGSKPAPYVESDATNPLSVYRKLSIVLKEDVGSTRFHEYNQRNSANAAK